jgi:hypothetical protein
MAQLSRALGAGLLLACLGAVDANACRAPSSLSTIFFDAVPSNLDAPIIARVTVIRLLPSLAYSGLYGRADDYKYSFQGLARVDEAIKGAIDGHVVKLISPASSCDIPFVVGAAGIVVGNVRRAGSRRPEFVAMPETLGQRRMREGSAQGSMP